MNACEREIFIYIIREIPLNITVASTNRGARKFDCELLLHNSRSYCIEPPYHQKGKILTWIFEIVNNV